MTVCTDKEGVQILCHYKWQVSFLVMNETVIGSSYNLPAGLTSHVLVLFVQASYFLLPEITLF